MTLTDDQLIEAAAQATMAAIVEEGDRLRARGLLGPLDGTVYVNFAGVSARAALEVFRREQVAPVDIDGCALCGFHCTHDAFINAAYQQGLATARREQGARDEALREAQAAGRNERVDAGLRAISERSEG